MALLFLVAGPNVISFLNAIDCFLSPCVPRSLTIHRLKGCISFLFFFKSNERKSAVALMNQGQRLIDDGASCHVGDTAPEQRERHRREHTHTHTHTQTHHNRRTKTFPDDNLIMIAITFSSAVCCDVVTLALRAVPKRNETGRQHQKKNNGIFFLNPVEKTHKFRQKKNVPN